MPTERHQDRRRELDVEHASVLLLEECRTVLPGVQALFGFQLIAVFSDGFGRLLSHAERVAHLAAMGLALLAIALLMSPAALHRQTNPMYVSDGLVRVSSRLLLASMPALLGAIAIDAYLVSRIILGNTTGAAVVAIAAALLYAALWFALPRIVRI